MIKASSSLQDLRRRLYVKAKAESTWCFWGLYAHVCKRETLREAERHGGDVLERGPTDQRQQRKIVGPKNEAVGRPTSEFLLNRV